MMSRKRMTFAAIAALTAAALSTAMPAVARGPGGGMDGPGMMGRGPMFDFAALDADKDGKITPAEIAASRQAVIAGTDANNDGKLSADEIAAQDMRMREASVKARAARMVADRDVDGDGLLSAAELAAPPMPDKLFDRVDTDKDGAISRQEVDAARTRLADRAEHGRRHRRPAGDSSQDGPVDGPDEN